MMKNIESMKKFKDFIDEPIIFLILANEEHNWYLWEIIILKIREEIVILKSAINVSEKCNTWPTKEIEKEGMSGRLWNAAYVGELKYYNIYHWIYKYI